MSPSLDTEDSLLERLTPYRIREVLLVSSHFDHYVLEESGHLSELMASEYSSLNLSQSPRIIHSPDAEDALVMLKTRKFDLVITMSRIGDIAVHDFAQQAKKICGSIQVVLLTYNTRELATLRSGGGIDKVFVWSGDSLIFLSICKLIEDEKNVQHDIDLGNVQVLLLVEDSRRFYSAYLPLLYTQLLKQTTLLMGQGANTYEKLLRLRARAKILLAVTYEEAALHIERYHNNIIGVFTDGRFPFQNGERSTAGLELIRNIRKEHPYMPILFQSKNEELREQAEALGASFLHKEDSKLYHQISDFMTSKMSFGDFIFRNAEGEEISRASDLRELRQCLKDVPLDVFVERAKRNHISHWMRTRTEFALATELRQKKLADFPSIEIARKFLIKRIGQYLHMQKMRRIQDHAPGDEGSGFQRLGSGSLGGKGRGLAFFYTRMPDLRLSDAFPDVDIIIPKTLVIATKVFEKFLERNNLNHFVHEDFEDEEIAKAFLEAKFLDDEVETVKNMLEFVTWPLAVRSSSQLEDASHQPFAGVYSTYLLANNHPNIKYRIKQIIQAIKLVYASTFYKTAKEYVKATPNSIEDERMAVVIQELVGTHQGGRFYPVLSGVARSHNHYPVEPLKAEDGLAAIALGFGRQVAGGGKCLRFSPAQPKRLHQFHNIEATLRTSQRKFYAIEMDDNESDLSANDEENLSKLDLNTAEEDGQLAMVGSTYIAADDRIVDTIYREGNRVLTFAPILKHSKFPLAEILTHVLNKCQDYLGTPVEIEFAVALDPKRNIRRFALLQLRPVVAGHEEIDVDFNEIEEERLLCSSSLALGNGVIDNVQDIIFIDPSKLNRLKTRDLNTIIEEINASLTRQNRPYLLIGPGRWGTADPSLGIPVSWSQISGAKTIVEVPMADIHVDPSQGSHFFQNIVSFNVGYLTLSEVGNMDWEWLNNQEVIANHGPLTHVYLDDPIKILLDSKDGEAAILKN